MKALIIIAACIILIRLLKRTRNGSNPKRQKTVTEYKITYKPNKSDRYEPEKEKLKHLQLENKLASERLKQYKLYKQAEQIKFNRYQARQDKINLETEKQNLLRNEYVLSNEKQADKFNKRIRDLDKRIEKAAFESIEF